MKTVFPTLLLVLLASCSGQKPDFVTLIDRDGRLRKRYVGLTSKAVFERDIAELLSESAESEDSKGSI